MTKNPTKPLITLDRITIRVRDRWMLPDTTWEIREGRNWVVLGPNGAGKSSLVRVFTGDTPVVKGRVIRQAPELRRDQVGYVSFELHEKLLARENRRDESRHFSGRFDDEITVKSLIESARRGAADSGRAMGWSAALPAVDHLADRPVRRLSVGEMRKVLIARALAGAPRLLILDEPFEGLDTPSMAELSDLIQEVGAQDRRLAVILATHRLEKIPPGFSRVLGLKDGRIVVNGNLAQTPLPELEKRLYGGRPSGRGRRAIPDPPAAENAGEATDAAGRLIEMKNVTVRYGDTVVFRALNWTMRRGEHWAVAGPNGSGKTTLLSLISGDNPQAYANRIYLFGRRRGSGETIWEIKRRIGMVSSEFQMGYDRPATVLQTVLSGFFDSVGLYRKATPGQRKIAEDWIETLNLTPLIHDCFDRLSFGQRRLVLLARAMVKRPLLLILDEPCQGLDIGNRRMIHDVVERIASNGRTHILYVTHFREELPGCITDVLELGG